MKEKMKQVKDWIKEHEADIIAVGSVAALSASWCVLGYVFGSIDNECKIAGGMRKAMDNGQLDLRVEGREENIDPILWCKVFKKYNKENK